MVGALTRYRWLSTGLLVLVGITAPLIFSSPYHREIMVMAVIFIILASGLNIILGYTGLLAFGYTAFFAIGAYVATLVSIHIAPPFWLAILISAVFTAAIAYLLGYLCLRLHGPYFAIMTFAFSEVIRLIVSNWVSVTNGPMGLRNPNVASIRIPGIVELPLSSEIAFYYVAFVLMVLLLAGKFWMIEGAFGRAIIGLRENERLASAVGIDPFRFKLQAWIVSAVFAGVAGAIYAMYFRIVDPTLFSLYYVFLCFSMVLIGGAGTFIGPVFGAVMFTVLPEALRVSQNYRMAIFAALLLAFVVLAPNGLAGLISGVKRRLET